ncbi:MAG: ABC transporter permease [Parvularculaceae bacterium]
MKGALMIAWREYRQYIFSRGFVLFIILTPLLFGFAALTLSLIDKTRPVRSYVVVDLTGDYAELIDAEILRQQRRSELQAWNVYIEAMADPAKISPEDIPFPYGVSPASNRRLDAFAKSGGFGAAQEAVAPYLRDGAPGFAPPRPLTRKLSLAPELAAAADADAAAAALRPYLNGERPYPGSPNGELFAGVVIPANFGVGENPKKAHFWTNNLTDPSLQMTVAAALESALRAKTAKELGLSRADLKTLADIRAPIDSMRPDRPDATAAVNRQDKFETAILPGALTYMLLVMVFAVGNPLLTNTIEERSNKIVEVLLASVTADQLMIGKLIGIAAVGLTMPAILLTISAVTTLSGVGGGGFMREALLALFGSNLLPVFVFYFLSAYVIYAMIFLAIGALSNSLQDAQTFMGPLMLVVFAPMPFVVMMFQNPNGPIASILTWIPIYTPFAAMMRAAADPPLWEILGATALMIAFAVFLGRIMGRIFKNALLNSSSAKLGEIWRLARPQAA